MSCKDITNLWAIVQKAAYEYLQFRDKMYNFVAQIVVNQNSITSYTIKMKNKVLKSVLAALAIASPGLLCAQDITAPTAYYLMHSSGLHLAKNSEGRAWLEAADVDAPQMLTFTPTSDGYYTIEAPEGGFLSLSGSYNASFLDNGTANNAQFSITPVNDFYIKLKCRGNNKFLGTDSSEPGSFAYADKSGTDTRHYWYLTTDPTVEPEPDRVSYIINPDAERQLFDGWGVSLCWWANMCGKWSDEKIDEIVDWLVSPDGLNFRIFRYNIGGGDDPDNANCTPHHMGSGKGLRAEMEGFKDSSDGPYIWTRDAAQRKIMLKIKEKRPDAVFEAFSNSCPWYMTYSGCVAGHTTASKDNLKPEYYEEFAHYLVDVCKHYKDEYGIEFKTLDPFNEPMTSYWGANGGQEGCHFDVKSQIEFIKVLAPVLKASGLNTVISASDETSVSQSVKDFEEYRNAGILDLVGQWNTHTYTADDVARAKISALCREENMPLWMSEVGAGGTGLSGNLSMAQKLINDMRYIMPSAWIDWQYIEENNDQWCLVKARSFEKGTYEKVKNYYVRSHFSRFIKEGYTILTSFNSQTLAARSPEGDSLVLVAVNAGGAEVVHTVNLSMFASVENSIEAYVTSETDEMADFSNFTLDGSTLSFRMPSTSIVTLIVPVTTASKSGDTTLREGVDYLICPRITADMALAAENGAVKIRSINYGNAQRWNLTASGEGHTLTNGLGNILTEIADTYALSVKDSADEGQTFVISSVDGMYWRIANGAQTKALDLEGEKGTDGTGVGVWTYDDTAAPVHRQWMFFAIPEGISGVCSPVAADQANALIQLSNPYEGALQIDCLTPGEGSLSVYNTSGVCLYTCNAPEDSTLVPMAAGYYIVCYTGASGRFAATTADR